jgi:predicted PurR-regulated permease PerM
MKVIPIAEPNVAAEPLAEPLAQVAPDAPAAVARLLPETAGGRAISGLFILAVFYTLYFARALLLPVVLAILFALLLAPVVRFLRRGRLPDPVGAALVLVLLLSGLGAGVYTLSDPAMEWLRKAPASLRAVEAKMRELKQPMTDVQRAAERLEAIAQAETSGRAREVVLQRPGLRELMASRTPYFVAGAVSTLVLLYFLLASGDLFLRKVVRMLPTLRNKIHAVEVGRSIQKEVGRYFFTISVINAGLGLATALALHLLGMPNPLLWGAMVMLLNFIPYLGPATSLVVLTMAALVSFDDLSRAWMVPGVFLALALVEGQFIQPILVGRRLSLNPVMVFLAFLVLGWLWGIAGMFTAVPILVAVKIFCDHIEHFRPLGDFLGRE